MSKTWVTSDLHLGHSKIILYCDRPFHDVVDMNSTIINNWNSMVKPDDTVYHLGDFCFYKSAQGTPIHASSYEERLNGRIVHVIGNHDKNNSVKGHMVSCVIQMGGYRILMQHKPPKCREEVPKEIDIVLCGHVHNLWHYTFMEDLLVYNVGVDVNGFRPIDLNLLTGMCTRLIAKNKEGSN